MYIKKIFKELDVFEDCCKNLDALGATRSVVKISRLSDVPPIEVLYAICESSTKGFDLPAMRMSKKLIDIAERQD